MFKKAILILALGIGGSVAGMLVGQTKAYACTNGVCGYFKNGNDSAWCNVLPDTSIKGSYSSGNCWLNSSGGNGHSLLYGDNTTAAFINDMKTYLNSPGGNAGYNQNAQAGAAFIIDYMLGRDFHNGSTGNGITDAQNQLTNWSNLITYFGAHQCSNSGQMRCPGTNYGINWSYQPTYFCTSPVTTSGYDPFGAWDTPLYNTAPGTCDHDWRASVPEIVFYWNDGANSFHIGSQCGNVQTKADKLPPLNNVPIGTISMSCASGSEVATVDFSDADGSTTGYIKITNAGITHQSSPPVNSGSSQQITLNPSWYDPAGGQAVTLWVTDAGGLGNGDIQVNSANTAACIILNCGSVTTTPTPVDPAMKFSVTVSATASAAAGPGTMQLTMAGVPGGTQSQSVTPSGSIYTATFNNVGPTGTTGGFAVQWVLTVGGSSSGTCPGTINVANMPYLNVYGGDIAVGASPSYSGGASTCVSPNYSAGAFSWNNHSTDFSGAGAQYAVQALAQILDVASALNSTNATPTGLSFANTYTPADLTKLDPTQGLFGGSFGATTNDCDFTTNIGVNPSSGDRVIGATAVGAGTSPVYIMNGDVYITGNIAYTGTGGWANVSQIPYYKLVVVGGNIYIDNDVTQLDGLYVAEPSGANGGHIYTCATAMRTPVNLTLPGSYTTCKHQLYVNGAFVAKQVQFGRTYGTVGSARVTDTGSVGSNNDAEIFNYTPELWLPRGNTPPSTGYAAITGLPPVL